MKVCVSIIFVRKIDQLKNHYNGTMLQVNELGKKCDLCYCDQNKKDIVQKIFIPIIILVSFKF